MQWYLCAVPVFECIHSAFISHPIQMSFFTEHDVLYVCMGVQVVFGCVLHECLSWLCKCHRDRECKCAKIDRVHSMFTFCMVCVCVCNFPLFVSCSKWKIVWFSLQFHSNFECSFRGVTLKNVPNHHYLIIAIHRTRENCKAAAAAAAKAVTKSIRCINTFNDCFSLRAEIHVATFSVLILLTLNVCTV